MLYTVLAYLTLAAPPAEPEPIGYWNACYVSSSINSCASLTMWKDPFGEHPNSFAAMFWADDALPVGTSAFRVTAWGFADADHTQFFFSRYEDLWGDLPKNRWPELSYATGTDDWDFAVGGYGFGAEGFLGWWEGEQPSTKWRFAWRGELQDRSATFDCIQAAAGSSECVTVTPEPATWFLLASGLLVIVFVRLKKPKRLSRGDSQ